jgi:hypothetical protein
MKNIHQSARRIGVVRGQNGTVLDNFFFGKSLKCLLSDVIAWEGKVQHAMET